MALEPGQALLGLRIELIRPPTTRREIIIEIQADTVNRRMIGEDRWLHHNFALPPIYLGLDYFPAGHPRFEENRRASSVSAAEVKDFGSGQVLFELEIQQDKSIKVVVKGRLVEDDEKPAWEGEREFFVPAKEHPNEDPFPVDVHSKKISLEPVHSWTHAKIHNNPVTWW